MVRNRMAILLGLMATTSVVFASLRPFGFVHAEDVRAVLHAKGIDVSSSQVVLLSDVPLQQYSSLDVVSLKQLGRNNLLVQLRCHDRKACLPFLAKVQDVTQAQQLKVTSIFDSTSPQKKRVQSPIVIRAGEHVTLVVEGDHLLMKLPVVCLENGKVGSRIRVRSEDGKRIYHAEVTGPGTLQSVI